MAQLLDGRAMALRIREKLKARVEKLRTRPGLAVILVGSNPASRTYVGIKKKACEEVGIHFEQYMYSADESEQGIIKKIHELNAREDIHGILVQLPLPSQNASRVIAEIDPKKDVDGFHPENLRRLKAGEPAIASAVALGVVKLIKMAKKAETTERVAVIVSSPLFAEPLMILLKEQGMTATVVDYTDPELTTKTKQADILILAVGHPGLIIGEMVKQGSIVIDVGTTKVDGVIMGDIDSVSVEPVAGALTPVPGGVGPMTVAMLLVNILKAYDLQRHNLVHNSSGKQ